MGSKKKSKISAKTIPTKNFDDTFLNQYPDLKDALKPSDQYPELQQALKTKPNNIPTIISPKNVFEYVKAIKPTESRIILGTEVHFLPNRSMIIPTG